MLKLFINATFHMMTSTNTLASGILVKNGFIEDIWVKEKKIPFGIEVIDLKGCHVYPGFIDTHTHSFEGGLYSQSLDLSEEVTIKSTLEQIDAYCIEQKKAKMDNIDAFRFDENNLAEKRFPSISELDSVCPDLPFILRRIDGHSCAVNSAAWLMFYRANEKYVKKLQLSHNSIKIDNNNNVLRGELNDKLVHWFHNNYSEQTILQAYRQASKIALKNGITTVHTMVGDADNSIMHYEFINNNLQQFEVEFILYPQSFNIKAALDAGASRIGGCILADGSIGSYTAALSEPYINRPNETGLLNHDNIFWEKFVDESVKNNLQIAVHCIGDKAIKQINDAYYKASLKHNKDSRNELIHCEITPDYLVKEISQAGSIPVMQPSFDFYWGGENGFYQRVLGNARRLMMNRFRSLIDLNIPITGGSDWYITELDAIQGIRAAVNHGTETERISLNNAINMYTVNAAYLSHDENRLGKLARGFQADFICFRKDLNDVDGLASNPVITTYKKGNKVFSNENL